MYIYREVKLDKLKFYYDEKFLLFMMFFIVVFFYFGGIIFLYLVVSVNNIECVIMLIWYGVDYNVVDEYGRISLYIAV